MAAKVQFYFKPIYLNLSVEITLYCPLAVWFCSVCACVSVYMCEKGWGVGGGRGGGGVSVVGVGVL